MKKALLTTIFITSLLVMMGMIINDNTKKYDNINTYEIKGRVLETDNDNVIQSGISKIGDQSLKVRLEEGKHKGEIITASNLLIGKMEIDTFYKNGDRLIVVILEDEDKNIKAAKALELVRQDWLMILFLIFILILIFYARFIGLKALFSFIATLFVIWKILLPGLLSEKSPLLLGTWVLILLTALIIFSIAGFTKKGITAFIGTICGLIITIGLTVFFGDQLSLSGMTSPFAETLLFSGHLNLNMKHLFYIAIIIGASGAAMDIAMDVAASMAEIKEKKPDISTGELIKSGYNVGRAVIGTMTTTLLLAYSGGYLTLLMLFISKNSSLLRIINLKIVAAEIMRTVVGSIGLVLVAPLTAIVGGWLFTKNFCYPKKYFKLSNLSIYIEVILINITLIIFWH